MTDERGWNEADQLFADVHRMLLRLAGRLPDEALTRLRELLGNGDLRYLPDTVSVATVEFGIPVTPADKELLARVLTALDVPGGEPQLFAEVPVSAEPPPAGPFRFAPAPPPVLAEAGERIPPRLDLTGGDPEDLTDLPRELAHLADLAGRLTDPSDEGVVVTLMAEEGIVGVWRTWRSGPDPASAARPVYLAEVAPGAAAWDLAYEAQRSLADDGDPAPQVEVYWTGDPLPSYHRAALTGAALLWAPDAGRVRVAVAEDELAALLRPGAPRVPPGDRRALLERLAAGAPLPGPGGYLPDLVEPGRGAVVPAGHRTDGRWVWPEALRYYLTEYGVAPPRELVDHLASGGAPATVDGVALFRAGLSLSGL
jgi:hypothetical protein